MATEKNLRKGLTEWEKDLMCKNEATKEGFRTDYNTLISLLEPSNIPHADHLLGGFKIGLCPYLQFIGIEALPKDKLFNNIPENGVYVYFEIDMIDKSVEVHSTGHVEMSNEDKKASYLCAFGLKNIAKAYNVKWFRKQKYKDMNDLAKRIIGFYTAIMTAVNDLTQGDMRKAEKSLIAKV